MCSEHAEQASSRGTVGILGGGGGGGATSLTTFIEFGRGQQQARLTEKASKLKIDYLAFLKNGRHKKR